MGKVECNGLRYDFKDSPRMLVQPAAKFLLCRVGNVVRERLQSDVRQLQACVIHLAKQVESHK
jgi:hypothetical protein